MLLHSSFWSKTLCSAVVLLALTKAIPTFQLTYQGSGPSNATGPLPANTPKETAIQKCYVGLKHNDSQLTLTPQNQNNTETVDDDNTISARLLTIDPSETLDRVVTLDNGKDCKIAVLLQVKECRISFGRLPSKWALQKSPTFKSIFSVRPLQDVSHDFVPPTNPGSEQNQESDSNPKSEIEMEQPTTEPENRQLATQPLSRVIRREQCGN
ncbi:hypothetical protein CROQUDRAFT_98289 [Cronartium quercuum f. sp. fusiforme G11]|uniref:Uncharacterized protein n=1 Tax=Cronartium quercuum f. sp. fusiforme G11 TaxID=708437 RepID=A0A9P6T795_9BASI|nr:hypothetical protein CROQUDRAFT_98289 [Cronartium quercuum f. sp. fusiforme G11]